MLRRSGEIAVKRGAKFALINEANLFFYLFLHTIFPTASAPLGVAPSLAKRLILLCVGIKAG
ncbi:hypothetical protein [Erwinia piriflorinigrans]|uniref:Uncharacterized protein n=1 Tax=Erwinia piriflorinigrans CFBP 5888 TaxID=1161919 RepID=V5ZC50_9GAMM|nr:hypothetical protein [Erwinia piriflorinigrans]CCG88607.1 hypothetical protein EPIR_3244 [Erwinia piriflorinigrans CFBP 5888]